jgi:hypothetical protein
MTFSSPAPRTLVAAAVLAVSAGFLAGGTALADSPTPTAPATTAVATPSVPAAPAPVKTDKPRGPSFEPAPTAPPAAPSTAPAAPAVPAAPIEQPTTDVPVPAVEATAEAAVETAAEAPTASPTSAAPSVESNWNKPITRSATPTRVASVTSLDGAGGAGPNLPLVAGLLLLGLAGAAFAWWGQGRLRAH